jgi:pimeloyl-ACP methyl ester carboxylesterase
MVRVPTGLRLHVREWDEGRDRAHTILVLHGFLDHAASFEPLIEAALSSRAHVVAPDWRGHGDSDHLGAGGYYHFADYVADLHGLVERLGRERVTLIGHSMGGMVASYYAGSFPERVWALALLEGLGPPESGETGPARMREWVAGWWRQSTATRRQMSAEEAAARLVANDPQLTDPELVARLVRDGAEQLADGRLAWKHDPLHLSRGPYAFTVEVASRFWGQVRCPVLFVDGGASLMRFAPEEQARRQGAFTRCASVSAVEIPGAGHMLHRHGGPALAEALAHFVDGLFDRSGAPGT